MSRTIGVPYHSTQSVCQTDLSVCVTEHSVCVTEPSVWNKTRARIEYVKQNYLLSALAFKIHAIEETSEKGILPETEKMKNTG